MSSKSITDQILHYQRDIDRCPENSERMVRCIQRLGILPVTVQHLQETGIGKSVNALRKFGGEVAEAAKSLVWKWKAMVLVEEQNAQSDGSEPADEETDESIEQNKKKKSLEKENGARRSDGVHQMNNQKSSHNSDRKRHSDSVNDHRKKKEHGRTSVERGREEKEHRHRSSKLDSPRGHASSSKRKKASDSEDGDDMAVSSKRRRRKSEHSPPNSDNESGCSGEESEVDESYTKKLIKTEPVSSDEDEGSADEDANNSDSENVSGSSASGSDKESERAASPNGSLHRSDKEVSEAEDDNESSDDEPVRVKKEPNSNHSKHDSSSSRYSDQLNSSNSSKHRSKDSERKHSSSSKHHSESSSSSRRHISSSSKSRHNERGENGSSHSSHVSSDRHSKPKSENKTRTTNSSGNTSSDRSKSRDDRSSDKNGIKGKDDRSRKSSSSSSQKDKDSRSGSHSKSGSNGSAKSAVKDKSVIIEVKKEKNLEESNEKPSKKDLQKELLKKSSSDSRKREDSPVKFNPSSVKIKVEKTSDHEEGFTSGSGASFGDALLGMTAPVKKKKKSLDSVQTPRKSDTTHSSSSSNKEKGKSSSKAKESKKMSSPSTRPLSNSSSPFLTNSETDLLSTNARLEPLDVDLAATLPEISANYRPLPSHSPTYYDKCPVKSNKGLTQEEALSSILSTKGQRMKVFSGNRGSGVTKIPSLFTLCVHVLQENIEALEYTGGVPYDLLKPVLERATSEQLYQLEHYNPYLVGDTDELWEFHCKKDFRGQSRDELESWRDLYLRCFDERERKFKALTENITQKKIIESLPIKKTKLAYVDSVVKPPRNVARNQAKYGTSAAVKHDLVAKAMIGGHSSSGEIAKAVVPPPPHTASRANTNPNLLKKKKAPLMAKTLQFMKGNRRKW